MTSRDLAFPKDFNPYTDLSNQGTVQEITDEDTASLSSDDSTMSPLMDRIDDESDNESNNSSHSGYTGMPSLRNRADDESIHFSDDPQALMTLHMMMTCNLTIPLSSILQKSYPHHPVHPVQ